MVLEVWPLSLPQSFQASGYGEATPKNNVITDDYNVGPPQYRRRTTSAPSPYMGKMFMTTAEWETLLSFFHTTLFDGVMRFLFPPQGATDTARFWITRFVTPPVRSMSDVDDYWLVNLSLERLGIGQVFISPATLFNDPDAFRSPRIIWDQVVGPVSRHNNIPDTFGVPRMIFRQLVNPGKYSNANTTTFYAPDLTWAYIAISFAEVEANT